MHALLLALSLLAADPLAPGDHRRELDSGGRTRKYLVHVPPKYDPARPTPVVLVFHGGGSNADQTVAFTGLSDKADEAGFVAVYPDGTGRFARFLTWNGGNCCAYAMSEGIDDVGFVRDLLDDLATVVNVDPKRVFATGMSNGAILSHRLGAELADRIAAIAPVAGPLGIRDIAPKRPVPVLHFHGTADDFAGFEGGVGSKSRAKTVFRSVAETLDEWIRVNRCESEPQVESLPDLADDGTTVLRKTYPPRDGGAEVVLIEIVGGGHTWPGVPSRIDRLGVVTRDVSANDLMWEFFEQHPLP